jgi:UDPglucose 6-dehydrogenase
VGSALDFLGIVDEVNDRRRQRVVDLAVDALNGRLSGRRIAVLGAAFKPNSDDVRDSPALHVAKVLHERGAVVTVHDPAAIENARKAAPELEFAETIERASTGAELVIVLTEWNVYRELNPIPFARIVAQTVVIDGRNALDQDSWNSAGWTVHALGRPTAPAWNIFEQFDLAEESVEKVAVS